MFRGTVSVMQRNIKGYRLVGGGIAVCVLVVVVAISAPYYRPRTTAPQWAITAVVVVVFLAAVFGFSFYEMTGH